MIYTTLRRGVPISEESIQQQQWRRCHIRRALATVANRKCGPENGVVVIFGEPWQLLLTGSAVPRIGERKIASEIFCLASERHLRLQVIASWRRQWRI